MLDNSITYYVTTMYIFVKEFFLIYFKPHIDISEKTTQFYLKLISPLKPTLTFDRIFEIIRIL